MTADINALSDWRFEIDFEGLAWATFDRKDETTNTLSRRAMEELWAIVERVQQGAETKEARGLVIISAKEKSFIAGADIREFESLDTVARVTEAVEQATAILDCIEKLPIPVVAAIHGYCLGGGLELAMACHYRIATRDEGTRIGLPEIKLGIFPGFNGTMRSIRLAGPVQAMQMMLTGAMLRPSVARAIGLVDELVPARPNLRWAARKAALQGRRSRSPSFGKRLQTLWPVRGFLARKMRDKAGEKARPEHYPAPFALIELFERHGGSEMRMKTEETRAFAPLMVSETARNLRRVFRLSEAMKDLAPKGLFKPSRVHVIGAGTMGADIAAHCVMSGLEVSLQDLSEDALKRAETQARGHFSKRYKTRAEQEAASARLILDPKGEGVARADVIIEAIVERLEVKRALFKSLEERAKPTAVLATNTSSIPIEDIAKPMRDPGRLIGLHFFNPVPQLPLVEVVKGPDTRESEVEKGCAVVTAIGKFPLVTKSVPGFLVNRVLAPYMMGAMQRLDAAAGSRRPARDAR